MYRLDTICGISTPLGEGGVGIVKISGPQALDIIKNIFTDRNFNSYYNLEHRKLSYGYIVSDLEKKEIIDEVLVSFMKAPNSYTTEDVIEINCHGGIIPVKKVLDLVLENGARLADRGEFTKRAFLNGRIDLSQAEAVMDLISAKTETSYDMAKKQLAGSVSNDIKSIRDIIKDMISIITVSIDFSEDDLDEESIKKLLEKGYIAKEKIKKLIETKDTGKILKEGLNTAIIGKTNVGKSSLLNALLRENRAIVTDIPGTTRDLIEESLSIKGILINIIDTAGIRITDDEVERIGVEKSKSLINSSDLVIYVIDGSNLLDEDDLEHLKLLNNKKSLIIINKIDLENKVDIEVIREYVDDDKIIKLSAVKSQGLENLENTIERLVYKGEIIKDTSTFINNKRHEKNLLDGYQALLDGLNALENNMPLDFVEVDIKNVYDNLGEITGESANEDLLDHIFGEFCIGK